MPRNFDFRSVAARGGYRTPRFWLQIAAGVLLVLNIAAAYLYVAPPGGSRRQLTQQHESLRRQIRGARLQTVHLQAVSNKVQLGSVEATQFQSQYFLPQRDAYEAVISEIERMANASGLQERDAVFSEDHIEGTDDLTLLNVTANYQGSYANLMHFLNEADKSPMLLMLDSVTAAPQQRTAQISTSIKFQAVVREPAPGAMPAGAPGGTPAGAPGGAR